MYIIVVTTSFKNSTQTLIKKFYLQNTYHTKIKKKKKQNK